MQPMVAGTAPWSCKFLSLDDPTAPVSRVARNQRIHRDGRSRNRQPVPPFLFQPGHTPAYNPRREVWCFDEKERFQTTSSAFHTAPRLPTRKFVPNRHAASSAMAKHLAEAKPEQPRYLNATFTRDDDPAAVEGEPVPAGNAHKLFMDSARFLAMPRGTFEEHERRAFALGDERRQRAAFRANELSALRRASSPDWDWPYVGRG
jgi:hypothetical protein